MYMRSKILQVTAQTAASFNSDPPYSFAAAKSGTLTAKAVNWGNVDNTLVVDVYWGERKTLGILPNNANLVWEKDTGLTVTVPATAGTAVDVVKFLPIPQVKSKFMRVTCTLAGTGKTVDAVITYDWKN